jgi:hypothetical protein
MTVRSGWKPLKNVVRTKRMANQRKKKKLRRKPKKKLKRKQRPRKPSLPSLQQRRSLTLLNPIPRKPSLQWRPRRQTHPKQSPRK